MSNLDGEMRLTLVIIQASCWGGSMHSTGSKPCVFPQMSRVFLSFEVARGQENNSPVRKTMHLQSLYLFFFFSFPQQRSQKNKVQTRKVRILNSHLQVWTVSSTVTSCSGDGSQYVANQPISISISMCCSCVWDVNTHTCSSL